MPSSPTRSPERLRHHFEVERELAQKLLDSGREDRSKVFATLYDELFERVPDHPRLTRRDSDEDSRVSVQRRLALLEPFLKAGSTLLEFAAGDCRLAYAACERVTKVIAADISDQRNPADVPPANFELVIYDGYELPVPESSVDLAFSYQFIEHLHPEDTPLHFRSAFQILKPGGCYVFDTPHAFSGPHDISQHFSKRPLGFHLKEWTYRELGALARECGFSAAYPIRGKRTLSGIIPRSLHATLEGSVRFLPYAPRKRLSRRLFPSVSMVAIK